MEETHPKIFQSFKIIPQILSFMEMWGKFNLRVVPKTMDVLVVRVIKSRLEVTQKQELYFDPSIKLVQKVVRSCALLNFAIWYWNIFLNKGGYAMHHLNAYFLLFFFFANDLLLSVYFIFILEMMLDKKQIRVFFLFVLFFF